MAENPLHAATLMAMDIDGVARLWESMLGRMPELLARYDRLVEEAVGGRGTLASLHQGRHAALFGTVDAAVRAAVDVQRALLADPALGPLRARVAIHSGELPQEEWAEHNPTFDRCVRIRDVGRGGQILLSESAVALAGNDILLKSLGQHRLGDLLRPEALFQVVAKGLPSDFPEPASLNGSSIPIQHTTFVGREGEIETIGARLRRTPFLNLVGPGGVGKTRLAYQVAAESARLFEDGAAVVELVDVVSDLQAALALALDLDPLQPFLGGLRGRRQLLVLDNCEHLLEEVRPLIRTILSNCPGITVLATSRQTTGMPEEERREILPLTLPPEEPESPTRVLGSEAGRLFVERAGSRLTLGPENMGAVAGICRRLDGLPLAIELAAARCDVLTPQEILDRLVHRFEVLARDPGAADHRHRTMQEAIEWSAQMLVPAERTLLARLTAFRGGWTLDAIEAALRISWDHLEDPFDVLRSLVDKSLVFVEDVVGDSVRYRFLETVREFVRGTMSAEERRVAAAGLFAWAEDFGSRASEGMEGAEQRRWFAQVDLEWENLRHAIVHGFEQPALRAPTLRLAVGLHRFWTVRGHYALGRALIEPALADGEGIPEDLRAKATNLVGVLAWGQGDLDAAEYRLSESLALAADDRTARGGTLCNLGLIAWERMDFSSARDAFQEGAALLESAEEWGKFGVALLNLGCVLIDMDRLDEAREALRACLEPLQRGGSLGGLAFADGNLGYLAIVRGDWAEAVRHVRESLSAFGQVGDWKGTMNTLISAATLLAAADDLERAATIRGVIEKMSSTAGTAPTPRDGQRLAEIDRTLDGAPEPEALRALRQKGLSMSPQHGVEYALYALMAVKPVKS